MAINGVNFKIKPSVWFYFVDGEYSPLYLEFIKKKISFIVRSV